MKCCGDSCGQVASFLDLVNIASVGFFTMAAATYGAAYLAPFLLVRMIQFDHQFMANRSLK